MDTRSVDNLTYAAFAGLVIFGGLNAIGVRYVVAEIPPFWGATIRFAPASLLLFLLALGQRLPLPRGRALLGALIYGIFNFGLAYAFAFWSLQYVPPGLAMVVLAVTPLLTLLFAILHRQETFRWAVLAGGILSIGGIAVIFTNQLTADVSLLPLLALVLNAVSVAEGSVLIKSFPKTHPITTNAIGMAAGTVILFIASLLWQEPRPLPTLVATWLALAYLILVGSCVVFILALHVLKRWTASATTYAFVLFPLVTVLASVLIGQEKISPSFLLGGGILLLGVYIGALHKPKQVVEVPIQPCAEEYELQLTNPGC